MVVINRDRSSVGPTVLAQKEPESVQEEPEAETHGGIVELHDADDPGRRPCLSIERIWTPKNRSMFRTKMSNTIRTPPHQ